MDYAHRRAHTRGTARRGERFSPTHRPPQAGTPAGGGGWVRIFPPSGLSLLCGHAGKHNAFIPVWGVRRQAAEVGVSAPSLQGRVLLTQLTKHGLAARGRKGTRNARTIPHHTPTLPGEPRANATRAPRAVPTRAALPRGCPQPAVSPRRAQAP